MQYLIEKIYQKNHTEKKYLKAYRTNPLKYLQKNVQNCIKKPLEGPQQSSKNHPKNPPKIQKDPI